MHACVCIYTGARSTGLKLLRVNCYGKGRKRKEKAKVVETEEKGEEGGVDILEKRGGERLVNFSTKELNLDFR